jgi:lipopolysaccharide export system permease protein
MSAFNEIVALKALGISAMAAIWPALGLATILSFTTVWLNDLAVSWGYHGIQRVVIDSIEDIAYSVLRTQKTYGNSVLAVTVREVEGRKLIAPVFTLKGNEGEGSITISARTAQIRSVPGSGELTLELFDATLDGPNNMHGRYPNQTFVYKVTVAPKPGQQDTPPAHLALSEVPQAIARQQELIAQTEENMVAQAGIGMISGDFDRLSEERWKSEADKLQRHKYQLYKMQTEPPRRWANGFSCLCFALVGSAMAVRRRNGEVMATFALCFLPILIVYYPLLMGGLDRAKAGLVHPYVVWVANLILVVWGLWLLRRVIRY